MSTAPNSFPHLHPEVVPYLDKPDEIRIEYIRSRVHFQSSLQIKAAIDELKDVIAQGLGPRRRNVKLIADSGMGKTEILKQINAHYPSEVISGSDLRSRPVVIFMMTAVTNSDIFCSELERKLGMPEPTVKKRRDYRHRVELVTNLLMKAGCMFCAFDEFQDLLQIKSADRIAIVQLVKFMANLCNYPICVAGSENSVAVLDDDSHMRTRFRRAVRRAPWSDDEDFFTFLFGVVSRFPLKQPSLIFDPGSRREIIARSLGNTEVLVKAGVRCAVEAIQNKSETIDRKAFFTQLLA